MEQALNPLVVVEIAPAIVVLAVMWARRRPWSLIWDVLGWRPAAPVWWAVAVGIAIVVGGVSTVLGLAFFPGVLEHPPRGTSGFVYARLGLSPTTVLLAFLIEAFTGTLGEEVLFRGLLERWLVEKLGFQAGTLLQALLFLIPHLLLLAVTLRLWPLLVVQFAAGWLLGWLRMRSKSIGPGWLSHTILNTAVDVIAMAGSVP